MWRKFPNKIHVVNAHATYWMSECESKSKYEPYVCPPVPCNTKKNLTYIVWKFNDFWWKINIIIHNSMYSSIIPWHENRFLTFPYHTFSTFRHELLVVMWSFVIEWSAIMHRISVSFSYDVKILRVEGVGRVVLSCVIPTQP